MMQNLQTERVVESSGLSSKFVLLRMTLGSNLVSFILHRIFTHSSLDAFGQAAIATLIAFVLVNLAIPLKPASVLLVFADRTTEEAFATVAGLSIVMLASSFVIANGAQGARSQTGCSNCLVAKYVGFVFSYAA